MTVIRTGRKLGRTLYQQAGPEPSDTDTLIGLMDTPELASEVAGLAGRVRELEAALEETRRAAKRALEHVQQLEAERDRAQAEEARWRSACVSDSFKRSQAAYDEMVALLARKDEALRGVATTLSLIRAQTTLGNATSLAARAREAVLAALGQA